MTPLTGKNYLKQWRSLKIQGKSINLTKTALKNVKCRIRIRNQLSDKFMTRKGLRQSDVLSCLVFNIALEKVIRKSVIDIRGTIFHIDITGRFERIVREAFDKLEKAAKKMGLKSMKIKQSTYKQITYRERENLSQ